jgi:hypothetical protein
MKASAIALVCSRTSVPSRVVSKISSTVRLDELLSTNWAARLLLPRRFAFRVLDKATLRVAGLNCTMIALAVSGVSLLPVTGISWARVSSGMG